MSRSGGYGGRASLRGGAKFKLLLFLAFLTAVLLLVWMAFLPQIVAARIEAATGFPTRIEHLSASPFTGRVHLEGLIVENPQTFGPRTFVALNEFRADLQVPTLFKRTLVFEAMKVDLAHAVVVTNTDGTNNLDLFNERWRGDHPPAEPTKSVADRTEPRWLIKELELSVGTIELINLTARAPSRRELRLDFDYTYRDVTAVNQLMVPALMTRMAVAGGAFENLLPGELGRTLGDWLGATGGFFQSAGRRVGDTLKSLFEKLEESKKP